jgi:hypothetical protein
VTFAVIMIVARVQNDIIVYMLYNITKINNIPFRYCTFFLIRAHFPKVTVLCSIRVH